MELLQLKYFCDAAKTENFSKTAEKFGVPASCISQAVRRLEKELSVKLFTRSANRIHLNSEGREFFDKVTKGLALIENAVNAAKDDGSSGEINICVNSNRRVVMQAVKKFQDIYPNVNISTRHMADGYSDAFDLVISRDDDQLHTFEKNLLVTEPLAVAINQNNPIANSTDFNLSMLADQPFICINKQSKLYEMTCSTCRRFGFEPNIILFSDDPFYVRKHVNMNLAVTIAPIFSWFGQFDDNVRLFPIDGCTYDTYVYTNPNKYESVCTKNFKKFLTEEFKAEYQAAAAISPFLS